MKYNFFKNNVQGRRSWSGEGSRYTAVGLYVKLEAALPACRSCPRNLNAGEETAVRARLRATGPTL